MKDFDHRPGQKEALITAMANVPTTHSPFGHLFITACMRSGTTALMRALNARDEIALGSERYRLAYERTGRLSEAHFSPERFLNPRDGEGHAHNIAEHLASKPNFALSYAKAKWVGDKYPGLFSNWRNLAALRNARFLILVREPTAVALSFEARREHSQGEWPDGWGHESAVQNWNKSFAHLNAMMDDPSVAALPLFYEDLYHQGRGWQAIADFLEIPAFSAEWVQAQIQAASNLKPRARRPFVERFVALNADYAAYRAFYDKYRYLSDDASPDAWKTTVDQEFLPASGDPA